MKRSKILKVCLAYLLMVGVICGLCAIGIQVQDVAYGKLERIHQETLTRVVVGGSGFTVNRPQYYNNPLRKLTVNDEVTIAFIQEKREIVYGCYGKKSLWFIVYWQRVYYWLVLSGIVLFFIFIVRIRFRFGGAFYMNMNLWRGKKYESQNPQLCH